jgi:rSAM/selenodomain-associated transferase 2/rSAM/selenodomain-associated transferase 1
MIPVCVFAKPFIPGQVKTRLAAALGAERAAALALAMFRDVWQAVSSCPGARPFLATLAQKIPSGFPIQISSSDILLQGDGDLGARLEHVFRQALANAPAAIVVGADSPMLTSAHLQQALQALQTHDAVIGPCYDGGFYLLGLRLCPHSLFSALPWSTSDTARATRCRLEERGFSVKELEALLDVDTPDDLAQLVANLRNTPSLAPATHAWHVEMSVTIVVPTLNEEAQIMATLTALQQLLGNKEILVVDGGSTDATVSLARAQGVTVLAAPQGRGLQMHAGALQAAGNVLWFIHADTIPPPAALHEMATVLEDESVVGGNFGLLFDGSSRAARRLTAIYPFLRLLGLCYGDSGIFLRKNVYEQIGGFRPLTLFEDLDLLRRLRRAGRFVHLPCSLRTSSRRFEQRNFALMWLHWTSLQLLYWCGVSPNLLARWY